MSRRSRRRSTLALAFLALPAAWPAVRAAAVGTFQSPPYSLAGGLTSVRLEFKEPSGEPLPEDFEFQLAVNGSARFRPNPRKGTLIRGAGTSLVAGSPEEGVFEIDVSTPVAEAIRFVFSDGSGTVVGALTESIFSDGVETGRPRWYASTLGGPLSGWSRAEVSGPSDPPREGTKAWWSGPIAASQDSALLSVPLRFPGRGTTRLRLLQRYLLEPAECLADGKVHHGARVEAETDPGRWTPLEPAGGYPSAVTTSCPGPLSGQRAFAGSTDGRFQEQIFDLAALAGKRARLRLRLITGCETCSSGEGWFADDIAVTATDLSVKVLPPAEDADGDGLSNETEIARGSDPEAADTDGDGLPDGAEDSSGVFAGERSAGTDPLSPDTDGGGVPDGAEARMGNDPNDAQDETRREPFDLDLAAGGERRWVVRADGTAGPSAADPLQELFFGKGGFRLLVNGLPFPAQSEAYRQGKSASTYTLGPQRLGPLLVTRSIFASGDAKYLRILETFENVTASAQSANVKLECEFEAKPWVEVEDDGRGGHSWMPGDDFAHFNDRDPFDGMPAFLWLYSGSGARQEPGAPELKDGVARVGFNLELMPGELRSILHFAVQSSGLEEGRAAERLLGKGGPEAAIDLPPAAEESIVNLALDRDGDGMAGYYEVGNGLDPLDGSDADLDPDGDGLTNLEESRLGSDPHSQDTDGDGLSDGKEARDLGTDPAQADSDSDGIADAVDPFPRDALQVSFHGDRFGLSGSPATLEVRIEVNHLPFPSPVKCTLVLGGPAAVFTGPVQGGTVLEGLDTQTLVAEVERGVLRIGVRAETAGRRTVRVADSAGLGLIAPTSRFDDFEADAGGLEAGGLTGAWKWGEPAGPPGAFSGKKAWSTGLTGSYPPDASDSLTTPELFFSDDGQPELEVSSFVSVEEGLDEARVQASENGGQFFDLGPPLENSAAGYQPIRWTLNAYRGRSVRIRFFFSSDGSIEGPGWFIDDLRVSGLRSEATVDFLNPAEDLDRDGLANAAEVARGTNPAAADTDSDGLSDAVETGTGVFTSDQDTGTDPRNPDTDGGGEDDAAEVKARRSPFDPFDDELEPTFGPPFFAVPLTDGGGTVWGGTDSGSALIWEDDFITFLNEIFVSGEFFFSGSAVLTQRKQMLVLPSHPDFFDGPPTTRRLYASPDRRFLRWLEVIENPGAAEAAAKVELQSVYFSFASPTEIVSTSSGDDVLDAGDRHFIVKTTRGGEPVFIGHLLWNAGAVLLPTFAQFQEGGQMTLEYSPRIPPRGKLALLHFASLSSKREEVEEVLELLQRPDPAALAGLREEDLAAVANFLIDQDQDGIPDSYEKAHGLDPAAGADGGLDADGDGLSNLSEYRLGTDPRLADTDGDGLSDGEETEKLHTDPLLRDTDGDGIPDGADTIPLFRLVVRERARVFGILGEKTRLRFRVEAAGGGTGGALPELDQVAFTLRFSAALEIAVLTGELVNPAGENGFAFRSRGGLLVLDASSLAEGQVGISVEDGGGTGISGDATLLHFLSSGGDADGDGLPNAFEVDQGTDPLAADTDLDGQGDRFETGSGVVALPAELGTFPWSADSDGGGTLDGDELAAGTDPLNGEDDLRRAALPVSLSGAAGKWVALPSWALTGTVVGANDTDNAGSIFVNGRPPAASRTALAGPAGTALALGPAAHDGLEVSRFVYAHPTLPLVRFTELIGNPLATPAAVEVELRFDFSADGTGSVESTSSGDARFDLEDRWVQLRDQRNNGVVHVFFGGPSLKEAEFRDGDLLRETFAFEVPAGKSRALVHFLARGKPRGDLRTLAGRLLTLRGGALDGLSTETARLGVNLPPLYSPIWDRFPRSEVSAGGRFALEGEFLGKELKILLGGNPAEVLAALPEHLVLRAPKEPGESPLEVLDADGRSIFNDVVRVAAPKGHFHRGDLDGDGGVDLTDAILIIDLLALGGTPPLCRDSADADDSGTVDITDVIYVLKALFEGGGFIPYPGGAAGGPDPTPDDLKCQEN